ncbi:hypothetical protein L596_009666 [Steinernema carpocapsae]|uniref:Uncharacterized protein n=1 Tax=Steinernema carpocapsae TaxID=34508 RepID=A0A4U5PG09_STECR|nr:hypothetical protein L596_009666 [Steinernema carpocapsae]
MCDFMNKIVQSWKQKRSKLSQHLELNGACISLVLQERENTSESWNYDDSGFFAQKSINVCTDLHSS